MRSSSANPSSRVWLASFAESRWDRPKGRAAIKGRLLCSPFVRYSGEVALEVGGYTDVPDWPKLGPSLLIATCLILAIRTARWPARTKQMLSDSELDREVDFAEYLAKKVLSHLMSRNEAIFPQRKQPWYQPDGKDCPE